MRLIEPYDAALFDLDGVVYLGPDAIPGVPETLAQLRRDGIRLGYVTNNAGRSASVVVEHLRDLGIDCDDRDVVTSAQAIVREMSQKLDAGSRVLVCGAKALADVTRAAGFIVVADSTEKPDAVVQGYDPEMTFPRLDEAGFALQHGARWFVSNTDAQRPTHRGLVPGAGAQMDAVATTTDTIPVIAGKPYPPLLNETVRRLETRAPIFVGDRLDTDVEGANNVDMDSLLVFTGAHGKAELVAAAPERRPTAIGYDVSALLDERREAHCEGDRVVCRETSARADGIAVLDGRLDTRERQLDALWALATLAWAQPGLSCDEALARLDLLR